MHSLWFVQWDFTRQDHPGNPGGVSGSGLVRSPVRSKGCLSSSFFIYRPLASLLLPSQDKALLLLLYGSLSLVMHLSLGLNN